MFGSQVLDVGIGLAMLFAFMSLIATALNEALEGFLKARAQQLEQGIRNILDEPGADKVAERFFNNPLISIFYPGDYKASNLKASSMLRAPPGVVSARARSMPRNIRANLPSYIPSANFALAVLSLAAGSKPPKDAADVKKGVESTLGDSPQISGVIMQALASGEDDLKAAQKYLEDCYDAAMDRVSGWYKRRTQWILFFIGLFAAVALNVDTIMVARSLIADPNLRQVVVNHAAVHDRLTASESLASENPVDFDKKALMAIGYPIGWANLPQLQLLAPIEELQLKPPASNPPSPDPGSNAAISVRVTNPCSATTCISTLFEDFKTITIQTLPSMILGWLITAFAITLGAPFWFDLLGKFVQIRSTAKPEPANDDNSGRPAPSAPSPGNPGGVTKPATPTPKVNNAAAAPIAPFNIMSVEDIQAALNRLQVPSPGLAIDGDYTPKTRAAVESFQKAHNLDVDGWVGPQTIDALKTALKNP